MYYPWGLWVLFSASTAATAVSSWLFVCRRDVPIAVCAPAILTNGAAIALIVSFYFLHNALLLEGAVVCSSSTLLAVGRISRYRWEHGGEERYLQMKRSIAEKRERRIFEKGLRR